MLILTSHIFLNRRTRQDASNIAEPTLELHGVWQSQSRPAEEAREIKEYWQLDLDALQVLIAEILLI